MPVVFTERFALAYAKSPRNVQSRVDKALRLLGEDFRHQGLRARHVEGTEGIYEARVDGRHRMTYHREGDRLAMRNVGEHDKTLRHP